MSEVAAVHVMLLGPPRVMREGVPVAFDTRKAVALLAVLTLADRPRPRDVLAELLWPERDAEHARGALRRTLSTLRAALGGDAVDATRDTLRLVRGPELEIDVDRFRALAAAGDTAAAADVFRGELLEGFAVRDAPAFEDWLRGEADALRRELAAVLERLVEATHEIAHARRWLELDPLNEPAHRALIRLYAEHGDRAAALAQYRECVRTLSRELGVPPLEDTTRLYEAISEGAAEQAAPVPVPAPLLPSAPLVGRAAEWEALLALYDGIDADGRVALLEGEAGIGKTRLAEELCAAARERGAAALVGHAYEEESGLAYGPIVGALRRRLDEDGSWVPAARESALAEAARLVPQLGAAPGPLSGPAAQTRFFEGVWDLLAAAVHGPVPGLVLVDDVQWADDASLSLLAFGLRRLVGRPLLVVLTSRSPEEQRLRRIVVEAERAGTGLVRRLERLTETDVGELLRTARPSADPELQQWLYAQTEGLPFLLVEYLNTGETGGDWSLPAGARDLLRARLEPVSGAGRQVLSAAAVIGRSFDVETVRAVSGRGDEETVRALEELVARGLIRERALDYDFAHEQLRALVYEDTGLARRRLLHGRAADTLADDAAVARHLRLAGRDAEAARAYVRAAAQARALFANAEALEHLQTALALGAGDPPSLHRAIGDLQTLQGDYAAALAAYETAAAEGPPAALADLEHSIGQVHHRRGDWTLAEAHLERALDAAAEDATRARIVADLSLTVRDRGDAARAAGLAARARELAEAAGDPRALGQAHNLLGLLATADGDPDAAIGHLARALALAERVDDVDARVAALNNLALAQRDRGSHDDAVTLTRAALDLCTAQGDRHREAALHNNLADLLHDAGRREEAMQELKRAVAIFADVGAAAAPMPEVWKLSRW